MRVYMCNDVGYCRLLLFTFLLLIFAALGQVSQPTQAEHGIPLIISSTNPNATTALLIDVISSVRNLALKSVSAARTADRECRIPKRKFRPQLK